MSHVPRLRAGLDHLQDRRGQILIAISAGWFLSIGLRFVYPVLLPHIRSAYDLSLTVAGLLLTVLWLAYAVGQLPGGMLADRFGEGWTMAGSMALAAGMLSAMVFAPSPIVLFVGTAAVGFSVALFGTVRLSASADVYPDHVGTAHGIMAAVGDVGNTVLPPLAGFVAVATVWQLGFGFLVPFFVAAAVGIWIVVPTRTGDSGGAHQSLALDDVWAVLSALGERSILLLTVIFIVHVSLMQAFTGFFPTYLIEIKGFPASVANTLFALFFALGIVVRPVSGVAYDWIGTRESLLLVTGAPGIAFLALPIVDAFWGLVVATIVISAMLGRGTIALAHATITLDGNVRNTGLGAVRTVGFLIGATSPFVFGAIADLGYFDEAFFLLAGISGAALLVIAALPSSRS